MSDNRGNLNIPKVLKVKCVCAPIPDRVLPKLDHPVVLELSMYYPPNPSINNLNITCKSMYVHLIEEFFNIDGYRPQ